MVTYSFISKIGSRKVNEDCVDIFKTENSYLFALADGLGGHKSGDIASKTVISKAGETFLANTDTDDLLSLCFNNAQDTLMNEQEKTNLDMKTTLVLLNKNGETIKGGHIGDSRTYIFQDEKLIGRTSDHSVPQMLYLTGEINEKDIRFHPDRNRLLRVMGVEWESPRYELSNEYPSTPGTSFLLCTDGFWELIDEKEMCRSLKQANNPEDWLTRMEKTVLKNGKRKNMDNYSAITIWIR